MLGRASVLVISALLATWGSACAPAGTYVTVDAEPRVLEHTQSLVVIVRAYPSGEPRFREVWEREDLTLPLLLELVPDRSERFTVEVQGFDASGGAGALTSSRLVAGRHGLRRTLDVELDAACADVTECRLDRLEGCFQGACVDARPTGW